MNDKQLAEIKRIKGILSAVTGLEDDDQEYIEDARKALQSIISQDALDKKAENARELGLDYEPAPVQEPLGHIVIKECGQGSWFPFLCEFDWTGDLLSKVGIGRHAVYAAAQPAVQEGRDWSLLEATQESLREHMAEIKRLQKEIIEQCRIIAMSAEREDALRSEIKRLKAEQPAPVQEPKFVRMVGGVPCITLAEHKHIMGTNTPPAQPAVQEPLGYIATMAANDLRASIYGDVTVYGEDLEDTVAIYTTPPAAQPGVKEG
jgi:hypothetical protein